MRRILIALNDRGTSEQISKALASSEYKIFISATTDEALEVYKDEEPELVLAELDLPTKGGDGFCKDIKKRFPDNNTFVIIACGATAAELRKCGRCGADSYIKTPVSIEDATNRLNRILQKNQWRAPRVLVKVRMDSSFKSDEFFCTSNNLSATGILLETEKSLARGDTIHCSFFLPDMDRIRTDCRVVRITKGENTMNAYGAEFMDLDESQKGIIDEFIERERVAGNIV